MKIQSISDIITNSSSEVFIIEAPGYNREALVNLIESFIKDNEEDDDEFYYSGMGGVHDVYDSNTVSSYSYEGETDPEYPWLPEGTFAVDIDHGFKSIFKRIREKFKVIDATDSYVAVDKDSHETVGVCGWGDLSTNVKDLPDNVIMISPGLASTKLEKEYHEKVLKEKCKSVESLISGFDGKDLRGFLEKAHAEMTLRDNASYFIESCIRRLERYDRECKKAEEKKAKISNKA